MKSKRHPLPAVIAAALLFLGAVPLRADNGDFTLAASARGDWARYSIDAKFPDTPGLNTSGRVVTRFIADRGADSVTMHSRGKIAGSDMEDRAILNRNREFEPVMGLQGAAVTVQSRTTEKLTVKGKTYTCAKITRKIARPLEMERMSFGLQGTSTIWMSGEVPLGLVKMVNDLTTLYSEDYGQRSVETWTYLEGGFKSWTDDVETGPEDDTLLFAHSGAGTSLQEDILSQVWDYGQAETAKADAEAPLWEAIRGDDLEALKTLEAGGLNLKEYRFGGTLQGEGNMFIDGMNAAAFLNQETTILMEAAWEGSRKIVSYLVDVKKDDVNRRARTAEAGGMRVSDEDPTIGRTALFFAVTDELHKASPERKRRKLETAKFLLSRGADPNAVFRDDRGAQSWGNLLVWALSCQSQTHRWEGTIAALLAAGADPNGVMWASLGDIDDDPAVTSTALMTAVETGILPDVKALAEAGAKVNAETGFGQNALDRALDGAKASKEGADILKYLKARGAKPGSFAKTMGTGE